MLHTLQSYYDLLVKSARDGTFPSINDVGKCKYKIEGTGKKCAVGILIPDDKYRNTLEGEAGLYVLGGCSVDESTRLVLERKNAKCSNIGHIQTLHDKLALYSFGKDWDSEIFIKKLNELDFFSEVIKENV